MRDASVIKTERLKEISKEIARSFNDGPVLVEDVSVWAQFNIGLAAKTSMEYIALACRAHGWIVEDGVIKAAPA